jgi:hypothetical protein
MNAVLFQLLLAYLQPQMFRQPLPYAQPFVSNDGQDFQQLPAAPMFNLNNLLRPNELSSAPPRFTTTVVTSSFVSTVTQTLSTVISIWFRNERIPTTIFSKKIVQVTETVTSTSTVAVEPTLLRKRRGEEPIIELDSSLSSDVLATDAYLTNPLQSLDGDPLDPNPAADLSAIARQPQVQEAWNRFLLVLEQVAADKLPPAN